MSDMSKVTGIAIPGCGDAYIMADLAEPVARLIISSDAEINVDIEEEWDDESKTFPVRIAFGESVRLSVSLLPRDAAILAERVQQVLENGSRGGNDDR